MACQETALFAVKLYIKTSNSTSYSLLLDIADRAAIAINVEQLRTSENVCDLFTLYFTEKQLLVDMFNFKQ